jgi:hypothetical protein
MWYGKFFSCVRILSKKIGQGFLNTSLVRSLTSYFLVSPQFSGLAGLEGSFTFAIVNSLAILVC